VIVGLITVPVVQAVEATAGSGFSDWMTILISLVVAVGGAGGVVQLLTVRSNKKNLTAGTEKIKAEAADILADSAVSLLAPLREELSRLKEQVKEQQDDLKEMEQTLARERVASDTRIKQLESEIAIRDLRIVELVEQGGL